MRKLVIASLLAFFFSAAANPQALPGEIPTDFKPPASLFDYDRLEVMIPMRDGVKLFTVIWRPRHPAAPMPMILTRTPYNAAARAKFTGRPTSPSLAASVPLPDVPLVENGYIRVYQDVRGKHGSEGSYVLNLPPRGPLNPGPVDQSTDAWDTIDWLVKNVPGNNGRVGIMGVSYEGWTSLMALFDPHPALRAAVPMNPMVDGWIGDDWYHNGAFRQTGMQYIYRQTTTKGAGEFPFGSRDAYATYLAAGSANAMARSRGMDQLPAWKKLIDHPAYDSFWQQQAVDKLLKRAKMSVPVMTVHGLFDQEDIYGGIASYAAMEEQDRKNDRNFLVLGPWFHGQQDQWFHTESGAHLGPLQWGSDTTATFLNDMLLPFFNHYLKDIGTAPPIPPVRAFDTGANAWRSYAAWPPAGIAKRRLYLQPGGALSFRPSPPDWSVDYVSDPAKPVPYRVPPLGPNDATVSRWLVDDQRPFASRPDVVSWVSDPLDAPVEIAGNVVANLVASTTGTDSDWVVKLIDVYPDEVPAQPDMGGYQLMVAADIMRGRYRESIERAAPIAPDQPLPYRIRLPNAHHRFAKGHRIMVQVQSSWFPLYDRNPQTFVPNIAYATPDAYRKATQRIHAGSFIEADIR